MTDFAAFFIFLSFQMIYCSNVVKGDKFLQNKAYFTTLTLVS